MKRVVIWGAGQGGRMMLNLLRADVNVVAFCDNNKKLQGTMICSIPVIDDKQLLKINPECIYIAILNCEVCVLVKEQIEKLGVKSKIVIINELRKQFDVRLAVLKLIAKEINKRNVSGSIAELGVYQGDFAMEMNRLFPKRKIFLFDTFEGFDDRDLQIERENQYSLLEKDKFNNTSADRVYRLLPYPGQAIFRKGYFPHTADGLEEKFALVSLDADLYQPMYEGLKFFYPRMNKGGYIILHDYNNSQFRGAGEAVGQFCKENNIFVVPLCDLHGSAVIVKTD